MDKWSELREWLEKSETTLKELADKMPDDAVRLNGKAEGFRAVISKMWEYDRQEGEA